MSTFENNIKSIYGNQGRIWLESLPKTVLGLSQKYELSKLVPVDNLSYNYVLSGVQGNCSIILKLGLDNAGLKQEHAALKAFSKFGAPKVLAEEDGMILLEQVLPGTLLKSYFPKNDDEATHIACDIMKLLHQSPIPESNNFPHVNNYIETLNKDYSIPTQYLNKAKGTLNQLIQTSDNQVLLHGDLHHDNILKNGNSWLVIDPKGIISEPAYEIATFIYNPIPEMLNTNRANDLIKNRIATFAKLLDLPEIRIINWCFVKVVLGWIWNIEDNLNTDSFEKLSAFFDGLAS